MGESFTPLPPAALHILLALAGGELHGYGIMQAVLEESGGRYRLGPGTLYDNLDRLMGQGLIDDAGRDENDPRKRYYRISALGRGVLSEEVDRLERVIREARLRMRAAKPRRT